MLPRTGEVGNNTDKTKGEEDVSESTKYVIIESYSMECAIVFDPAVEHARVTRHAISAGFCSLPQKEGEEVTVWGKSNSLGVESRPEDAQIIQKCFFNKLCPVFHGRSSAGLLPKSRGMTSPPTL